MVTTFLFAHLLVLQTNGDSVIRGKTEDSEIVIRTTQRCAGAISSLTWRGHEFIDSTDHGRELQSASNFDAGSPITAETYNPTEAGSRKDGAGPTSSSTLKSIEAEGNRLHTLTMMAFWLAPGENSGGNPAKNKFILSNHFLSKDVRIGMPGHTHIINYDVTFLLPLDKVHHQAVFESLTGYMPPEFSSFWHFDSNSKKLQPLSDGPGEQADPVVLSTPDGKFAMGIFSPESKQKGYGRWKFIPERVVKWNCVFRLSEPQPNTGYGYHHFVVVGTRDQVQSDLVYLESLR